MNIFAGNFSIQEEVEIPDIDFDIIKTSSTSFFIMGADETIWDSKSLETFLKDQFWNLLSIDMSIESEDRVEILSPEYEGEVYECVSFEWPNVNFEDILERFVETPEAICVREAQESKKYKNKLIKVDFLY